MLLLIVFTSSRLFSQVNVVYPNINGIGEEAFGFAVLKLALDKSGIDYTLTLYEDPMTNSRIRKEIKEGLISVADFGTSPQYEESLQAIYIPIDLGLNGWRLLAIRKNREADFESIRNLSELSELTAGQGKGWSDTGILRRAGLNVEEAPQIDNLLRMLNAKRFDYFPLGANEIHSLLKTYRNDCPDVIVERNLVLVYRFGRLFFVKRGNDQLADALYLGLEKAMEDGSFIELFRSHSSNRGLKTLADLGQRKRIIIDNPFMTNRFRQIPQKYFYPDLQP